MSRRAAAALIALAAALALAGILWLTRTRRPAPELPPTAAAQLPAAPQAPAAPLSPAETRSVTLWLPAARGLLAPLEREVSSAPELKPRLAALLAALLEAQPEGEIDAVFPEPVSASAQIVTADGTLYVDLRAADGGPPPGAGSTLETQRIYSIVHTVLRNEPRIERVVLLWNGVQRESLAGHVDTRRPLLLRPELEAE